MTRKLTHWILICGILGVAALFSSGCYTTLDNRKKLGVPFSKDVIENRYERSDEELFEAARSVLEFNGQLLNENTLNRTLVGKVDNRTVWVRTKQLDPSVGQVLVQARKKTGRGDVDLASEIATQIALKLVE